MPSDWEKIDRICQQALGLAPDERAAFIQAATAGDEDLCREIESLLSYQPKAEKFLGANALHVAAKGLVKDQIRSLVGHQIGPYKVVSLLGAGGMGEVYRAVDTRLSRTVAIKLLPSHLSAHPDRRKRFEREARAICNLNHPHICTLYDIGQQEGFEYLVMEYVAGETLDQRIPRKGMRLQEVLKLAVQIADALGKAHSAGIVHRDLKPTNVMVTDEGLVKVLDFGLAKLTEVSGGEQGETQTLQSQTQEGMIVGTLSYMSPEQAEGKKIDARSDIFSFGAVLYEMVSGQKAFEGDSRISTLAAIVKQEPKAISQLVPGIPLDLEKTINRCLRKDPERRFQHMADVRVALQELKEETDSGKAVGAKSEARPVRGIWVGAALALVAIAIGIWSFREPPRKPVPVPEVVPLTSYPGIEQYPSFSPDDNQVTFSWNGEKQDNFDIYIKLIGSPTAVRLTSDPAADISPAFSPDGRSIGFVRESQGRQTLIIIPAIGGPERVVAEIPGRRFAWLSDSKWVVTDGLALLSTESGETRSLTSPPPKSGDGFPAISPDGHTVAFSRFSGGWAVGAIYLLDLTEDLKPKGEPRRLASFKGLSFGSAWTAKGKEIVFSSYFWGSGSSLWKVPVSGAGESEQLPFGSGDAWWPAISRSGTRLAYERQVSDANIWRLSLSAPGVADGPPNRFIASTRDESSGQYSPDGKRIAFESEQTGAHGIWVSEANGSHLMELSSRGDKVCGDPSWSPDGQYVAFSSNLEGNLDIYIIKSGGGKPARLTTDSGDDIAPSWSRDGKWVYFSSPRTGRDEVWKVSAGGGAAVQVTQNGGGPALESADGKSIYYIKDAWSGALWQMPVDGSKETQVLRSVVWRAFCPVDKGIYFIPEPDSDRKSSIQFLSLATGKVNVVAPLSAPPTQGLSVSPDGRFILFSQQDQAGSDLMLVENFR